MGKLIPIDYGGTLTGICVTDGDPVSCTKALTTRHDLSSCFFGGVTKVSKEIYGRVDRVGQITSTDRIRLIHRCQDAPA